MSELVKLDLDGHSIGYGYDAAVRAVLNMSGVVSDVKRGGLDDISIQHGELWVRARAGERGHTSFSLRFPPTDRTFMTYSVFFPDGFDFGGNQNTAHSGGKLPGMMRGEASKYTGGNWDQFGWSGRLMWRGQNETDRGSDPPTSRVLSWYPYVKEIAGVPHDRYGRTFYFGDPPFDGWVEGTDYSDPWAAPIETGQWVDLILEYDTIHGDFNAWQRNGDWFDVVCMVDNIDYMAGTTQGADRLFFQTYWGGADADWMPDSDTELGFKNLAAFTTFDEAAAHHNKQEQTVPPTTTIPLWDTAWQMFAKATPNTAEKYAVKLKSTGFAGAWSFLLHHPNATIFDTFPGGGALGYVDGSGNIRLTNDYISHVRAILDRFATHGVKMGVGVAWQNSYLPGGDPNHGVAGMLHVGNAYAYGQLIHISFGDHPAIDHYIVGGDAGKNNTDPNIQVWRNFAAALADMGNSKRIAYHSPTSNGNENDPNNPFRHLNYAGEGAWLDIAGLETGHTQTAGQTRQELEAGVAAYRPNGIEVWQGEPRYTGYTGTGWPHNNYGRAEAVADAIAAREADVDGYVFGTWARWPWAGHGFNPNEPQQSFGPIEDAVIAVFAGEPEPPPIGDVMQVKVLAKGSTGQEEFDVIWDGGSSGTQRVFTDITQYVMSVPTNITFLHVEFTNDGRTSSGQDKNLFVDSVEIDGVLISAANPGVVSTGTWDADERTCDKTWNPRSNWLQCGGHFDFSVFLEDTVPDPDPDVQELLDEIERLEAQVDSLQLSLGSCTTSYEMVVIERDRLRDLLDQIEQLAGEA